ncbi:MAG: tyrosine-type recombinase/integrase [Undibacterium sp.]|uniref:tyrosine-type recombinase/integrase n=1 Tax=Undibacterium sp. TaxID=1914977 RepID=UPI0027282834|nr:tyrosine-type recombinase/integrase [Undibacterium sp.]MDO8654076.1 tyrosine-type recombinase/integrase [Undibacterium sp.]
MKLVEARRNVLLLNDDGSINFPASRHLTAEQSNPNTRELTAQALRIFHRFCVASGIDLPQRALDGRCLSNGEVDKLAGLCYRPLSEIEEISDRKVVSILSAKAGTPPEKLPGAVQANTAKKRLVDIAGFLEKYREVILDPNVRSDSIRTLLRTDYDRTASKLKGKISGTKQSHHLAFRSLPCNKYEAILRALYVRPEELFLSESGMPSRTMYRDRAMALLAAEGLRVGTINNIQMADVRLRSGHLLIVDNREKRGRPKTSHSVLKMAASSSVNNASETMISLWPFTQKAISDYLETERDASLSKTLANQSNGFLFVTERGNPIQHRSSVTKVFSQLGRRLKDLGLLDVDDDPHFSHKAVYDFYGHVLRHSAAVYYCKCKGVSDSTLDSMKSRFGWTRRSEMPQMYAARALADQANVDLMDFAEKLEAEVSARVKPRKTV